jgi:hypothetical protein
MDLFNFKVVDLGHEYVLRYMGFYNFAPYSNSFLNEAENLYTKKVVFMCLGFEIETHGFAFALLTIHESGKLAMFKFGDGLWSIINDMGSPYMDLNIVYDGFMGDRTMQFVKVVE